MIKSIKPNTQGRIPCEIEELELDWEVGDGEDGGGGWVGGRGWDVQSCTFSSTCRDGPAPHAAVKPRVTVEDSIRDAISRSVTTKVVFIGVLFQFIVNVFEVFNGP